MLRCKSCGNLYREYHPSMAAMLAHTLGRGYCPRCMVGVWPPFFGRRNPVPEPQGRTIGIEVECNPDPKSLCKVWCHGEADVIKDGSLRGKAVEIRSPILGEQNYAEWVDRHFEGFKSNMYNRQGLHIWLGAKDLSWYDINRLLVWCNRNQKDILALVSPIRRPMAGDAAGRPGPINFPNRLCKTKGEFLKLLYGIDGKHGGLHEQGTSIMKYSKRANCHRGVKYNGRISRYWWLNVHGYFHRRAIEVRLHQGTVDPEKIKNWIALWKAILDHFANSSGTAFKLWDIIPSELKFYYEVMQKTYAKVEGGKGRGADIVRECSLHDSVDAEPVNPRQQGVEADTNDNPPSTGWRDRYNTELYLDDRAARGAPLHTTAAELTMQATMRRMAFVPPITLGPDVPTLTWDVPVEVNATFYSVNHDDEEIAL